MIPNSISPEDEEGRRIFEPLLAKKRIGRPSYEDTFFSIAEQWAKRSTCLRRSVGCVIVDPYNSVVASGYNGAPRAMPHCLDVGCLLEGGHCVRAIHSEINAIAYAARRGISLKDCRAYCTLLPCIQCMQALMACGVQAIYYDDSYRRKEKDHVKQLAGLGNLVLRERNRS